MKKQITLTLVFVMLCIARFMAQTYIPVATTGYTLDGVAENTTAIATTGGPMDASDFNLYSQYYGTLYGATAVGLPNNGSIVSGTRTYQLQNYNGPNVLFIQPSASDTLTFVTPQAFPGVSLLSFATQGNAVLNIKVRFNDNTTQVFNGVNLVDWFTANPSIYNGFDRVLRTTGVPAYVGAVGNPRMFGTDLAIACANQGKLISRIVIQNSSTAYVCVMAVAGAVPGYSVNGNTSICSSGTSTLNATGFATYTWQAAGAFAGSNSATINVSPSTNTTYTLQGTDVSGCPGYTTVTVNVSNTTPVLSLTGSSQSVCLGAAATLSASGAVSYTWTSGVSNGVPFFPTSTTTYSVTGANGCGTVSAVNTVSVGPIPVALSSNTTVVCTNKSATLTVNAAATSFTWLPMNTVGSASTMVVNPSAATIYTVLAKNGLCSGSQTLSLLTNTIPVVSILSSGGNSICPGDAATLTASGGINYTWTTVSQNTNAITVSPANTSTYAVSGDNSAGCLSSSSFTLVVYINPNMNVAITSQSVCAAAPATITASGAGTYVWVNGPATNTHVINPVQTTIYTVTGTFAGSGCTSTKTISIYAFDPTLSISGNTVICLGNSTNLNASGAANYTWMPGGSIFSQITASPLVTTIYTLNARAVSGILNCPVSQTIEVLVNPVPTLTTVATKTAVCTKETNTITASGALSYTWTAPGRTVTAASATVTANSASTIIYTVTATNAEGCTSFKTQSVSFKTCTGINELSGSTKKIVVYPNPSQGEFTVQSESDLKLSLINGLGQVIQTIELNKNNGYKFLLSGVSNGVYFIVGDNLSAKIIVSK